MYFLRVFRSVGYLTSMILQVLRDMQPFLLILIVSLLALSNAFFLLSLNNDLEAD